MAKQNILVPDIGDYSDVPVIEVLVRGSQYKKCGRCWHHTKDVGSNADHPDLCGRCISNLFGDGDHRLFA